MNLTLKPVEKYESGAFWCELHPDGRLRIVESNQSLQVPWGENWHIVFKTPFEDIECSLKVDGTTSEAVNITTGDAWVRPTFGWLLSAYARPAFRNLSYKGWMVKVS